MRLKPGKSRHIGLIRDAKLLSPADKARLIADVEANDITETNEPEIVQAYEAEMARSRARFLAVTSGIRVLVDQDEKEINQHIRDHEKAQRSFLREFTRYCRIRRKLAEPPRLLDYFVAAIRYFFRRRRTEESPHEGS